jgi:hypothetical protein
MGLPSKLVEWASAEARCFAAWHYASGVMVKPQRGG